MQAPWQWRKERKKRWYLGVSEWRRGHPLWQWRKERKKRWYPPLPRSDANNPWTTRHYEFCMTSDTPPFPGPLADLVAGALAFRKNEYGAGGPMPRLAAGQQPQVLMIGCSDSRVDPALLCGAQPGELFVVRHIANLAPAYDPGDSLGQGVRAALEYGVKVLKVSHIVVLGHSHCGGIRALIDTAAGRAPALECVGAWLSLAGDVCEQVLRRLAADPAKNVSAEGLPAYAPLVERQAVLHSLHNLRTYPWISDRIAGGTLSLHGWWFALESGRLWTTRPPAADELTPLEAE